MGKRRKRPQKRAALHDAGYHNALLEATYRMNPSLIPQMQWEAFRSALLQPLPTTFRLSCADQAESSAIVSALNDVWGPFVERADASWGGLGDGGSAQGGDDTSGCAPPSALAGAEEPGAAALQGLVPKLTQIPYYCPRQSAWRLEIPRHVLRRPGPQKAFHEFLMMETEHGGLSRQVSPPLSGVADWSLPSPE